MTTPRAPTPEVIRDLFANANSAATWAQAVAVCRRLDADFDLSVVRVVFDDVMRMFDGVYPGYQAIRTLYHDRSHTLDVFICAVRLMHGVHLAGTTLSPHEMRLIMIAALLHDVGYALAVDDESGSGAQYTRVHVDRGIGFMKDYLAQQQFPVDMAQPLEAMILCTNPAQALADIVFPDERVRLLGKIVGAADLVGQMADRTYLEKLLFLYMEFKEAQLGDYRSMQDLLQRTLQFYEYTRNKLQGEFSSIHTHLSTHFRDWFGVENNYYQEAIEKNIAYLQQVLHLDEAQYLKMLKRGGVVEILQRGGVAK